MKRLKHTIQLICLWVLEPFAMWVSKNEKSATSYLENQGIDVDKVVKDGLDHIRKLKSQMPNNQ